MLDMQRNQGEPRRWMDPYERIATIIWLRYEIDCEDFDRKQPGIARHDEWIPVGDGRTESVRFARKRLASAWEEIDRNGIHRESAKEIKKRVERFSFEKAKEALADLLPTQGPSAESKE